jgi:ribose transport system ATP-binding protein
MGGDTPEWRLRPIAGGSKPATQMEAPLVRFRGVVKQLGGTLAVAGVDLDVAAGEIHALLGANGAGKSTMIKLLAGVHEPDQGEIYLRNHRIDHVHPRPPMAFIHQDLGLIDWMSVSENIALVQGYQRRSGLIHWGEVRRSARKALEALGSDIDPDARVGDLPRTERSIVAIVRALAVETDVLVLDEPTASLPESETAQLFDLLHRLRAKGVGIVYVTHRLDEVFRLADRVTVLRDGRRILTKLISETTPEELVFSIVGRPPAEVFIEAHESRGVPVLRVENLRTGAVGPVSFHVNAGEIVGLAGLRGAGQNAVGRALCGIDKISAGRVVLAGEEITPSTPRDVIGKGVMFVTSNREAECLASTLSVVENIFLNPGSRGRKLLQFRHPRTEREEAAEVVRRFSIRPEDPNRAISTLSGGNQQKVVLARWIGLNAQLLVLEDPTMGIDVGAKADIYRMLTQELKRGAAVLLISSDLEEVAAICNRALVFNRGRIVREVHGDQLSTSTLTSLVSSRLDEDTT